MTVLIIFSINILLCEVRTRILKVIYVRHVSINSEDLHVSFVYFLPCL
jgi:hypothetical protein